MTALNCPTLRPFHRGKFATTATAVLCRAVRVPPSAFAVPLSPHSQEPIILSISLCAAALNPFTTDGPWPFFLTFHIQSVFGFCSLAINFVLILYAFCAGDCYNPHTSMWRSMKNCPSVPFRTFHPSMVRPNLCRPPPPQLTTTTAAPLALDSSTVQSQAHPNPFKAGPPYTVYDIANGNFTVLGCTAQRPYLFLTLIARQWAALLVLFMGLERLLFVLYPLWLRSIRMK
ncbi:hypothetical protein niasHT_006058 [Heterodera trifolii]|uniref:Uncharacterized protein n=1 Tax=Heterodera trifolii TaxID=157864 RepID=A0ABD2M1E7_9BILA